MKKLTVLITIAVFLISGVMLNSCKKDEVKDNQAAVNKELKGGGGCVSIQEGTLVYPVGHYLEGEPYTTGYDIFGTNYQAHMFNGYYANNYLGRDGYPPYEGDAEAYLAIYPEAAGLWYWEYRDINVVMKWNDAWLSNKDCDGDGSFDRHN
jgi:hypothetical protein